MERKCMGVTHFEFDFDGGSCLRLLERIGKIQGCIFGEESLKNSLKEGGVSQLIFADANPSQSLSGVNILVYDHHRVTGKAEQEEGQGKTAFDILLDTVGSCGLDSARLEQWRDLVKTGDKKSMPDDMDVTRALKRVHAFFENDIEVYNKWFVPLFDGFFDNKSDVDRAIIVLQDGLLEFIRENPDSPVKFILKRWLERLNNKEKLLRSLESTPRNFLHFLAYLDKETAKKCVWLLLQGYHKDQVEFQDCKKDFLRPGFAKIDFFGNTLVVSSITTNRKFTQVARYMIHNESERKNLASLLQEKIQKRGDIWYTMIVNPKAKNFQIFVNGSQEGIHVVSPELIKAIRVEILLKRGMTVPDKEKLAADGTIEGTDPLYFHKDVSYQNILWGSLKHPNKVRAVEFGNTSTEIYNSLVEIVKLALDPNEPTNCNPSECKHCSINLWQLQKCEDKRKSYTT